MLKTFSKTEFLFTLFSILYPSIQDTISYCAGRIQSKSWNNPERNSNFKELHDPLRNEKNKKNKHMGRRK